MDRAIDVRGVGSSSRPDSQAFPAIVVVQFIWLPSWIDSSRTTLRSYIHARPSLQVVVLGYSFKRGQITRLRACARGHV